MKYMARTVLLASLAAMGCASTGDYVFRDQNRPTYDKTVNVEELKELSTDRKVTLLDVRLLEDYQSDEVLIPGAIYSNPENIQEWSSTLPEDSKVVVYCVKGKWVSQKAAHYLAEKGFDAYSLEGGIEAWQRAGDE